MNPVWKDVVVPIVVGFFGFLGVLVGAFSPIIIKWLEKRYNYPQRREAPASPESQRTARRMLVRLAALRPITIAYFLLSLTALIVIVMLPGEENAWFLRMNRTLMGVSTVSCAIILALLITSTNRPPSSERVATVKEVSRKGITYFIAIIFVVSFGYLGLKFYSWLREPPNVKLVLAAYDAYDKENYRSAIVATNECIRRFGHEADRLEASLAATPEPPVGKVSSAQEEAIFSNGVLNDVATCYWIQGSSALPLYDNATAKAAFADGCRLVHARSFDTKGFFWSPARDACDRLQDLK
jgi:hypothetical protein